MTAHGEGRGENVGGVWEIRPGADTWIAKSIAVAAGHPLGVGDALYRHTKQAAEVDTVPFGSFRRALIQKIGFFDESLLTNEDYEFNVRVRESRWLKDLLDPSIRSIYFARPMLSFRGTDPAILALWFLEMANAPSLSRYAALETGVASIICDYHDCSDSSFLFIPWRKPCSLPRFSFIFQL